MTEDVLNASAQSRLKSIVERIERLEEDKAAIATDIKEVFAEAKGEGFDAKILRMVVRIRKQDKAKRQEEEALLDLYLSAIEGAPIRTESAVRVAVSVVSPPAPSPPKPRASKRPASGAAVQWHDVRLAPKSDDQLQVYRGGGARGRGR